MTTHSTPLPPVGSARELAAHHRELSSALADALTERAFVQSNAVTARARLFESLTAEGHNITTIRESIQHQTAGYEAETLELTGRIDALRARIHHLDLLATLLPEDT